MDVHGTTHDGGVGVVAKVEGGPHVDGMRKVVRAPGKPGQRRMTTEGGGGVRVEVGRTSAAGGVGRPPTAC
jgi:hypothetical protein